jgi:hypothetical protein
MIGHWLSDLGLKYLPTPIVYELTSFTSLVLSERASSLTKDGGSKLQFTERILISSENFSAPPLAVAFSLKLKICSTDSIGGSSITSFESVRDEVIKGLISEIV